MALESFSLDVVGSCRGISIAVDLAYGVGFREASSIRKIPNCVDISHSSQKDELLMTPFRLLSLHLRLLAPSTSIIASNHDIVTARLAHWSRIPQAFHH